MTMRPTYANLAATAALIISVTGGTALAATQLAAHSVGTKHLKKNAVTTKQVKNHSLRAVDFAAGQLPAGPAGAPASAFVGYRQLDLSIGPSACGVTQVTAPGLAVGETAVVAPRYDATLSPAVVLSPGLVTTAGVLPVNVCNHSTQTQNVVAAAFGVWRLAGAH
jgi:hypothetical protein